MLVTKIENYKPERSKQKHAKKEKLSFIILKINIYFLNNFYSHNEYHKI